MGKEKIYFEVGNEEHCFPLDYFIDRIYDGEKEIALELAKIDYRSGFYWCSEKGEPGEVGDGSCGRGCESYSPRNKISGRCRFSRNTYTLSGERFVLTLDWIVSHGLARVFIKDTPVTYQATKKKIKSKELVISNLKLP